MTSQGATLSRIWLERRWTAVGHTEERAEGSDLQDKPDTAQG